MVVADAAAVARRRQAASQQQRQACRTQLSGDAQGILLCLEQWQPIALALVGLLTAVVLYTRDPGRCPLRGPAPFGAAAGGVCCRTVWMSEAAADGWLVRGLVCALPFAAASWFAFDDGDKLMREWGSAPGFSDPIPVDMSARAGANARGRAPVPATLEPVAQTMRAGDLEAG